MNYTKITTDGYADISVIIPVYNCENYLRNAVQSVLDQPLSTISVILVDDGSTDASPQICDELARNNYRVSVIHTQNQGVSCARNTGLKAALEDSTKLEGYIAFLDADDMWAKDFFDSQIQEQMQSKTDLLCFHSRKCSCDMRFIRDEPDIQEKVIPGGRDAVFQFTNTFGAVLYSRDLLRRFHIRFDKDMRYNEDKVFLIQCLYLAGKIRLINKVLYLYRMNLNSAMHTRQHGIPYYLPIINGWLQFDMRMAKYWDEQRGELLAGKVLAQIYFVDIASEHYEHFGRKSELETTIMSHPFYDSFLMMSSRDVSQKQYKEFVLLTTQPRIFMWKHYLIGVFSIIPRAILANHLIRKNITKLRFSQENKYI